MGAKASTSRVVEVEAEPAATMQQQVALSGVVRRRVSTQMSSAQREEAAAVMIQRHFRGRQRRKEFLKEKAAAITIQSRFRGMNARRLMRDVGKVFVDSSKQLFNWFTGWGAPIRAAFDNEEFGRISSPDDANFGERLRDRWMAYMVRSEKIFLIFAALFGIGLVGFFLFIVALMFPLNFGIKMGAMSEDVDGRCKLSQYDQSLILFEGDPQYPPRIKGAEGDASRIGMGDYVAYYCTPAQFWFNVCCKYLSFYFGYINLLPVPWTISIFANAYFPRKAVTENGVNFYGEPTESLWFHLPRVTRKKIATMALVALLFQIPDCCFHAVYWHYLEIQT